MARADIISRWQETLSFAVISTARRLRLSPVEFDVRTPKATDAEWAGWDYIEVDNRGNATALIYWAVNGRTASSSLATAVTRAGERRAQFRLYTNSIDRVFIRCTSISVVATVATTIFVTVGRY